MSSPAPSDGSDTGGPSQPPMGQATQHLYAQVFGGESDSDLSDDDEAPRQPARRAFPPRAGQPSGDASGSGSPRAAADGEEGGAAEAADEDEDRDEDDDRDDVDDVDDRDDVDEDDAYVPGTAAAPAKIPKFKKKPEGEGDDVAEGAEGGGDDSDREARRRKKKDKKAKRRNRSEREVDAEDDVEEAAPVYDEETQRRMALEERIDNIGKKTKQVRRKRKGDDVDIVDNYHDEICGRLRDRMLAAAERDRQSNLNKQPATAKLAMLDEAMGYLRNVSLWQPIVDNGVLDAVRVWLEPIRPSGALPAVGIQKALFEVLPKMDLDTQTLKECRLGPIVLFYTKTKRVTPVINRQADALVSAWSRPIIKRPSNFRSKHIDTLNGDGTRTPADMGEGEEMDIDGEEAPAVRPVQPIKRQKFNVRQALEENRDRKGARVLIARDIRYTVAPQSRSVHYEEDRQHVSRIQMDNKKFNKFARQMQKRNR